MTNIIALVAGYNPRVEKHDAVWCGKVERLGWGGLGLARHVDGKMVLLSAPLVLFPGEEVEASLTRHARHLSGDVLAWHKPDPRRVEPICPVATECGGCSLWGAGECAGELKRQMAADLLARQLPGAPEWQWLPAPPEARRQRIQLHWDGKSLGYHARGSHRIVTVDACPQAVDAITLAMPQLRLALVSGTLPSAPARWELATGTPPGLVVATCAQDPRQTWVQTGSAWSSPAPGLTHAAAGMELVQSPGAFFQACAQWAVAALAKVFGAWDFSGSTLYDLYGGGGLFSRMLTERFERCTLVESSPLAIADARANLAGLQAEIIEQSVERWLKPGLGAPGDTILLDPPRAGLGRKQCAVLAQAKAGRIVLCGCDGAAFCRDVRLLAPRWRLNRLAVIDLFPNTPHVECIGELLPAG